MDCLKDILLSGDTEMNPRPDKATFCFCSWSLHSICAHEFMQISLLVAYNAILNYDLIGIVETNLNDTVDETKLTVIEKFCVFWDIYSFACLLELGTFSVV